MAIEIRLCYFLCLSLEVFFFFHSCLNDSMNGPHSKVYHISNPKSRDRSNCYLYTFFGNGCTILGQRMKMGYSVDSDHIACLLSVFSRRGGRGKMTK